LRLVLLAVLSLLFQQVALASYACSTADMTASNAAMGTHCDGMAMVDGAADANPPPILCAQHCTQQIPTTQDARLPTVPPLLLPALLPVSDMLVILPVAHVTYARIAAWRLSAIPPELRFRVLLI
jgi:hypothetical protein